MHRTTHERRELFGRHGVEKQNYRVYCNNQFMESSKPNGCHRIEKYISSRINLHNIMIVLTIIDMLVYIDF
jgi:hypothetical protein